MPLGGPLARLQMQTLHHIVWGLLPEVIARLRVTLQRPPSKGGSCIGYLNTYEVSIILLSGAAYGDACSEFLFFLSRMSLDFIQCPSIQKGYNPSIVY